MKTPKTSAWNSVRLTEIVRIPWGGNGGMSEVWVPTPQTSVLTNKVPHQMRASVRIRTTPWNELIVLANDPVHQSEEQPVVYRFSQKGTMLNTVKIEPPTMNDGRWRIEDFLMDEAGYLYLLETFSDRTGQYNYLRRLTPDGEGVWVRSGLVSAEHLDLSNLKGMFHQLLINKKSMAYIAATAHRGLVMRIDGHRGILESYADWGEWTGEVYMDGEGKLYYVRYLPAIRKRGWTSYDPQTRKEHVVPCDDSLYGFLAMPIAVDEQGQAYAVMGMHIVCLDKKGSPLWQEHIDNIIIDEEKSIIYTSSFTTSDSTAEVVVRESADGGEFRRELTLALPPHLVEPGERWQLIYTDSEGKYYIYGGETPQKDGTLVVYSSLGALEDVPTPVPDVHLRENRLQAASTWSIDSQGNVYLPLLGSTGLHIIELSHI